MTRGAVALSLLLVLTSCAQPSSVTLLDESELPRDVYGSPVPTPSPTLELPRRGTVYMVEKGRLVPVERPLQGVATSVPAALLLALFQRPPPEASSVISTIPPDTRLNSVSIDGSVATVDLSDEFDRGGAGRELRLRVAQVVYTVTEDPEISTVVISVEGDAQAVPDHRGVLLARPVGRDDYSPLLRA